MTTDLLENKIPTYLNLKRFVGVLELDGKGMFKEQSTPNTPPANNAYLYAKDKSSVSNLYWKSDDGTEYDLSLSATHNLLNSSFHPDTLTGTVVRGDLVVGNSTPKWSRLARGATDEFLKTNSSGDLAWAAAVTGTGVSGRVAFWNGTSTLTSDADMTFATDTLSATKVAMSSLTSGRIPFATTVGLLIDSARLTWDVSNTGMTIVRAGSPANLTIDTSDTTRGPQLKFAENGTTYWQLALDSTNQKLQAFLSSASLSAMQWDTDRNTIVGTGVVLTTATAPFLNLNSCAGTPTGVPTAASGAGQISLVYDTTNNKLYAYNSGWKDMTGGASSGALTGSGTSTQLAFWTGSSALSSDSSMTWDNTNKRLLIGTMNGTVDRALVVSLSGTATQPMSVHNYSGGVATPVGGIIFRSARGTAASPTAVKTDDTGVILAFQGYGATGFTGTRRAAVIMRPAEDWTDTLQGTYLSFETTTTAAIATAERFRVGPAGQWGIGGATFGTSLDVFTSGGSAAAPTWTTPGALSKVDDTNVTLTLGGTPLTALLRAASLTLGWTGTLAVSRGGTGLSSISSDWLSQYFLLAGRSGGQNGIAGTAAGDDLGLYATSNATPTTGANGSGAVANLGIYSGATHPIATAFLEDANTAAFRLKSPGASKQINLEWADGNTRKWVIYKLTTDELAIFDDVNSQTTCIFSTAATGTLSQCRFHSTWVANTANAAVLRIDPTLTGSANGIQALTVQPAFTPSANIAACYANLSINTCTPPAGVTISQAIGGFFRSDYAGTTGVVTQGVACYASAPSIASTLKPGSQYGVFCGNQGVAGITTAINLLIDTCGGATNNFDLGFLGSDGTAVGAYFGRIPILYAGLLKYLAVYS
jgi:hypothetical protein